MNISNQEKPNDPNYANLKMLSFAYTPQQLSNSTQLVYGLVVEFSSDPFSVEKKFLTCYDSGFTAFYTTHHGGSINGNACLDYSQTVEPSSFELFMASTTEQFPDATISKKTKQLLIDACDYIKYTKEEFNSRDNMEVKFWLLTCSGVFSAGVNFFEVEDKSSVWTNLFNDAYAIGLTLPCGVSDKGKKSKAVSR